MPVDIPITVWCAYSLCQLAVRPFGDSAWLLTKPLLLALHCCDNSACPQPNHEGVITAAAAFAVNLGVENISGFKFWATLTLLERGQPVASFLVYALVNCALVGVSVYVTVNYAPAAAGSGIAEVKVSETMVLMGLILL
jgi:hypothetical protein